MTVTRTVRRRAPRLRLNPAAASLTAIVFVTLVFATAACSGSDGSDGSSSPEGADGGQQAQAATWAEEVCTTVSDWKVAVDNARATLSDKANLSANGVRDAVDGVAAATDALVADLDSIGPPDITAGDEAQAQLSTLASQLKQEKDTLTSTTSQSSTTMRELLAKVSTITGALATMLTEVAATVEDIGELDGAEELTSAFQDAPTCQQLQASASPGR
jgi:hypothetical protein